LPKLPIHILTGQSHIIPQITLAHPHFGRFVRIPRRARRQPQKTSGQLGRHCQGGVVFQQCIRAPQFPAQRLDKAQADICMLSNKRHHIAPLKANDFGRFSGNDRGRPRFAIEERDFPDHAARPQPIQQDFLAQVAEDADLHGTRQHDHQTVARLALPA